jgi:hypothetical protein
MLGPRRRLLWAGALKGSSFLTFAMRPMLSCTAPFDLLERETLPYIHFNDAACSKS